MRALVIGFILVFMSCSCSERPNLKSKWEREIIQVESDFEAMAAKEGIHAAFVAFADSNAVILRGDSLYQGRQAIDAFYAAHDVLKKVSLTWKPDVVEVSASGDLAYTYGKFLYRVTDSLGSVQSHKGLFHTIWKRQPDGSWKYVWD